VLQIGEILCSNSGSDTG